MAQNIHAFITAGKRTTGTLHERAAQILDLLQVSDPLCPYKHNAQQVEWALVAAYRSMHPECQAVSLWVPQHKHTKVRRVCILCARKSDNIPTKAGAKSEQEDKAEHVQAFREFYDTRKPTINQDKTIKEVEEARGHGKARPLGFPPIKNKPEDYCPASIAEFIKAVKLFPVDPPKEKQYRHKLTLEERAYKALRYLFPQQDHRSFTPAQIERALVAVHRADHPESGAVSLWIYERKTGTKKIRHCILCDRSSQEYATPTFYAKYPEHPTSTQAEREDKAKHLLDFADFVTWKCLPQAIKPHQK
jgi:hypothetical protein